MTREEISAEIHKCYCRAYERRFGKPYWTNGNYSKLDEPTKDYDREMATWHMAEVARIVEPLIEPFTNGRSFDTEYIRDIDLAIEETLKRAKVE